MKISDAAVGRDNNFNLVRFIAAFLVLISHSFAIVLGPMGFEPLERNLHYTLGEIAVDVFFVSSGFLVTGSLLRLGSVRNFASARALRIYPGLFTAMCVVVFLIGPIASSLSLHEYAAEPATWLYLARNSLLFMGIQHTLPGVFTDLPLRGTVNGSLWTLPFEIACYATLAAAWIVLRHFRTDTRGFAMLLLAATLSNFALFHLTRLQGLEIHHAFRLFFMFFGGAVFFVAKEHIALDWRIAASLAALIAASAIDSDLFIWIYPACVVYLTLFAAYAPGKFVRKFNGVGDYSYGIYIYAFPIQQLVVLLSPNANVLEVIAWTSVFTLVLACLSWHLIEKPALARKGGSGREAPLAKNRHPRLDELAKPMSVD